MSNITPPRFVPTLTESMSDSIPTTAIEDIAYFQARKAANPTLDVNLGDLKQQPAPVHPTATAALSAQASTATAQNTDNRQNITAQHVLPPDWQNQLQQTIQQTIRHELQQQLPFLLLQWSKQIEDKISPQIQQRLVKMLQNWQKPAG